MPDIVLATLNAKFIHAAFGLRCLRANLGALRERSVIAEFDIQQRPVDIAERILALEPQILGLGVYVWNVGPTAELVALLKRIQPGLCIVLGGPEVSHETEHQPIVQLADYVITGEGDQHFAWLCQRILERNPPAERVLPAPVPDLAILASPYEEYTDADIANRLVYVEASRGCPFECEFCLSSLDVPVRQFPLEPFLSAMDRLLERGVRHFKFVDRTFNLNLAVSRRILGFFRERLCPGLFLHFEMVPDRLPEVLRETIAAFPPGSLQFEVGVQTFNPTVGALISRRQDYSRLEDNLRFLKERTGVHVHADLIAGLPGEGVESFAAGFDRLVALGPHEIQVGILKRLRGTPLVRHDREWEMVYSPQPPYEILSNRLIDFPMMQRLRRFARFWDLLGNSGNFVEALPLLWAERTSPFAEFQRLSDWLFERAGRQHGIALPRLMEWVLTYLTEAQQRPPGVVASAIWRDFQRGGRSEMPPFLRPWLGGDQASSGVPVATGKRTVRRQSRHWASTPDATRSG